MKPIQIVIDATNYRTEHYPKTVSHGAFTAYIIEDGGSGWTVEVPDDNPEGATFDVD